jgi:hypothetical protein
MKQIKISGLLYDVVYKSNEEMEGRIGLADFNRQLISVNESHTSQTQQIALMHEILHLLDMSYNLKLTEEQVVYTTHSLIALFADNPELTFI